MKKNETEIGGIVFSNDEIWALAELCKRIGYSTCRENAVSDEEAHRMISATDKLRTALEHQGFRVR